MVKGFPNATLFQPESMNTTMGRVGSQGAATSDVTAYLKQAGGAAAGSLMATMARSMGLKLNDPTLKAEFDVLGKTLITNATTALEQSGKQFVNDDDFEQIVIPALKNSAKGISIAGQEVSTALQKAVTEIRTVSKIGIGGGTSGGAGRLALPGSYRADRLAGQQYAINTNPEMFRQQVIPSQSRGERNSFQTLNPALQKWETGTMAHIARSMNMSVQNLMTRVSPYLGDISGRLTKYLGDGVAKGMKDSTKTASPSKETQRIGADIGQGAINGLNSKVDDAARAGEKIGQATVNGTQAGATRAPGKRDPRRIQTGLPGAGGFPVKTTSAGSQIIIGDTGKYIPKKPENFTRPAPGISETPIGPMTEKEYKKQEFAKKYPTLSKVGGSISNTFKGMGGMGAGMGLAMAGGTVASMVPGLEGVGTAASIAGSAMMMIPGPVGIVIASLIGLVGIIMSVQAAQEKQKQAAIDLANAQIMSMDKLNTMAEDLGTVSATESRIAAEDAAAAGVSQETVNAGKQYLTEMASGQQIIEDIKTQQSAGIGSSEIGQNVAADMATAVSQGVVTQQQAQEIIAALGSLTGDRSITANASQQFGTYMEDPTKAPGMVASDRLAMVQRQFAGATTQSTQAAQYTTVAGEQVLVSPEKTTSSITDPNAAAGAVSATMNAYGQAVGGVDAINAKAAADIQEAKTTKEISEIVKQRNIDLAAQKVIIAETYAELEKQKTTITATKFDDAFLNSFDKDSDMYNTAKEINNMKDSDIKMQFQADFAGGNMSQATAESIIGAVDSEQALIGYYKLKVAVEVDKKDDALISRLLGVPTKAMTPDKPKKEKEPVVTGGDSGGGSSTPPEDKVLTNLQAKLDKRSKALNIISLQEAKINKKYDERKKALEEIAKLNSKIAEQQKSQLDIADALSRGDIAAAARAVQAERARAAAFAQEQQMTSLEEQRKRELSGVEFKGKTREELEKQMADLQMKIAKREYRNASGGGLMKGYAMGGMMKRYSAGGRVMSYFAGGGSPLGSDTIPAMLTPGEFVVKRPAVQNFGVKKLEAINSGNNPSSGVYNYSISVNVSTDANPDQIARAVAQNVKRTESYRIRGNKL
jgi:hypothetical protein